MQKPALNFVLGSLFGSLIVFTLYNTLLIEHTTVTYLPDGGKYTGEKMGELLHGTGYIEWPEGSSYKGTFRNGTMEGKGVLHTSDGSVYEGEFKGGIPNGHGTYKFNGYTYTGEFQRNLFHGQGEYTLANDDRYEGEFKNGVYHGKGDYLTKEEGRYTGEFVDGEFTGQGIYEYPDGSLFEGTFKDWAIAGDGVMTHKNGDKYIGNFSDGVLNGDGEYISAEGKHYKGGFQYGLFHGKGEYTDENGSHYTGNFEHGYYHGEGTLIFDNGDRYVGQFEYGRYHGMGTLTYGEPLDGMATVTGKWKHGKLYSCEGECHITPEDQIAEAVLYNQNELLNTQLGALRHSNSNKIDMYFLGVAGYGSQAVFRREVLFTKNYFDSNLNTKGTSAVLINDRSTIQEYPLATATSVQQTLQRMAEKMDANEDILFVFLSSHGSKTHQLNIEQPGLELRDISAEQLADMVKSLPVKWKVIIVSSCYSGGYIPYLQDDHTLVITAAARDKKSFGCNDSNQFTHFGEAFFKDALPQSNSFVEAFEKAKVIIAERETENDYTQSEPQINQPEKILKQLKSWRTGLAKE